MEIKIKSSISYIIILAFFTILLNNCFYGFGWTDEALYLSILNSNFQGNEFFFFFFLSTLFYSLFLIPLYSLILKFQNNTDNIYLIFRIITLIFQFIVVITTYKIFSQKFNKNAILISVLGLFSFARACIPGPSYYTFCLYTFIFAIDLIYAVFILNWKSIFLFIAGFFLSFAVLCNPYLVLVYALITILLFVLKTTRKELKKILVIYAGIIFTAGIYLFVILKNHTFSEFLNSLTYTLSAPEYSGRSFIVTIKWLLKFPRLFVTPLFYYFIFTILSILCIFKNGFRQKFFSNYSKKIIASILLILNYLSFIIIKKDCGSPIVGFFYLPFFMLFIFSDFSKQDFKTLYQNHKIIFYTFIIPGLSLSFMECLCSDTGFGVFAIGMVVCFIGIIPFFYSVVDKITIPNKKIISVFLLAISILVTLFYRTNLVYRDSKLSSHLLFIPQFHKNIGKIEQGPAKGIYTSRENLEAYNKIYEDVKNIEYKEGDTIFISKLVPWVYLVNPDLKTNAPTTWRVPLTDFRLKEYFETEKHEFPTHILIIDEAIRDNNINPVENTWMFNEIMNKGYEKKEVNCGILYTKKN